jgi:hypothetical protein
VGFCDICALRAAVAASSLGRARLQSLPTVPPQPEPVPSVVRMVFVIANALER